MRTPLHDRNGFSLAVVLFVVILLSTIGLAMSTIVVSTRTETAMELDTDRAAYIARAGFERTCAEILMNADQWDTLTTAPFTDEAFSDGIYTVTLSSLTADGCTVTVLAGYRGREHELAFTCTRQTAGAASGPGSVEPTNGVNVASVADETLTVLSR